MTKQSVGILAAIAVALFAYIAIYERHTLSSGALEGRDNRVAQEYSRHEVGGITIERPDQPTIELVRVREDEDALGHWEMRAPIETMGDDDSIGAMLGSVDWADARRRIAEVSDEDRTAFGLDAPRVTATFRMGNDELVLSVGGETPGGDGVWVTTDIESQTLHAKLIMSHGISAVWLREPRRRPLTGAQELLLLISIFAYLRNVVAESNQTVRFQARLNDRSMGLERLRGSLSQPKLNWQRVKPNDWQAPLFPPLNP